MLICELLGILVIVIEQRNVAWESRWIPASYRMSRAMLKPANGEVMATAIDWLVNLSCAAAIEFGSVLLDQ